ncbi:unnamed protein product [Chrysodeixis includens]|uniref:Uncharacterized protein n=1 Tax=Chrysodeixis includens TaxID=689277 RepID=A0A9N8L7N5_CHRIL|nr:unnamed protein product [Chrysodeixis includens]
MTLISNASGYFTLIGFGVRGPGCAAPARFIDLSTYFNWINSVTTPETESYDSPDYRRLGEDDVEYIPTHDLYRDIQLLTNCLCNERSLTVAMFAVDEKLEMHLHACEKTKELMYAEYFELHVSDESKGVALYKLSFYDIIYKVCVCVILKVDAESRSDAVLSFKEEFEFSLGTQLTESSETPEELFRYYPKADRAQELNANNTGWEPNLNLRPRYLKGNKKTGSVLNYDLYIKFEFHKRAKLKFELYAKPPAQTTPLPNMTFDGRRRSWGKDWNTKWEQKQLRIAKKRKKEKQSKKKLSHQWGLKVGNRLPPRRVDSRVRQPAVTVVVEQATEVQETVSRSGRVSRTLSVLVLQLYLCYYAL